ncbi:hypothetical protein Efla_001997 [Eimeria flavescens]
MASGASGLEETVAMASNVPNRSTAAAMAADPQATPRSDTLSSSASSHAQSSDSGACGGGSSAAAARGSSSTQAADTQGASGRPSPSEASAADCVSAPAPHGSSEVREDAPDSGAERSSHAANQEHRPGCSAQGPAHRPLKSEPDAPTAAAGRDPAADARRAEGTDVSQGEQLDIASLFLSPFEDLDSWATDDHDLLLPASSFVSADAISQHLGPMTLGRVALFLFGLFQGDVRMGILSAQGRLLAWRCLLYLAELHDRQSAGAQAQQQSGGNSAGAGGLDPGARRRRLQRESVATSKGRRSVRHAFLLDRSGASRATAGGQASNTSGLSPGANDEWGDAEEDAAPSTSLREDPPGEAANEQALATPGMTMAMTLQRQLQQGPQTIGFEPNFTRFIGGTIDRRWALQQRYLRIPAETLKGEASGGKAEPVELRLEEFGSGTAPRMWPRSEALPEQIFVGLPIQVACWIGWGRQDGSHSGRMLWRDCEVVQILPGGMFKAVCFFASGEPRQLTCHIRDFIPPRLPVPCPHENAWRLMPMEADAARDIYPGACLSVGLSASYNASNPDQQQQEVARAYFVDVVVQDVYFSMEQITRARQALAEVREREEASGARAVSSSRRFPGCADTGGPVEGLRPNCPVRAVRVMVLRSGGAAKEFALVSGSVIYKLGYDMYTHGSGLFRESAARQRHVGVRLAWAIPRVLSPMPPARVRGTAGAAGAGSNAEATAKRWQYKTQEDSRDWVNFPPFIVAYMPYDCSARYTQSHPLLLRYLQPELDLASLSRGVWSVCLPQYEQPSLPPALVAHPSDLPHQDERPAPASGDAGGIPAEGVTFLESPYNTRSGGGSGGTSEGRSALNGEELGDSLYATHTNEPPQVVTSTQNIAEPRAASSVLSINHLTSLLCSATPAKDLLPKALPFFRGLLSHLGPQFADTWQVEIARAAMRAADHAKELYIDEQETEVERLRRQGISFGEPLRGSASSDSGRDQQNKEQGCGSLSLDCGEAWETLSNSVSRYPTSSDISRFLLRTSAQHASEPTATSGRSVEGSPSPNEPLPASAGTGRRRPFDGAASMLPGESRRDSSSEFGASEACGRGEDTSLMPRASGGGEGDMYTSHRLGASSASRAFSDEALSGPRARSGPSQGPAGSMGTSPATARRKALTQREEDEDFQPPARSAAGSRQVASGGRVGMARRAARNISYTALAGMDHGLEDPAFYRPVKRVARGEPHTLKHEPPTIDHWDQPHAKDAGNDSSTSAADVRASLQQWAALHRQAAAAEERLLSSQGTRPSAERTADAGISTDQLEEALKGFVQSIKAGASRPVVAVPPLARNRSFAASH